MNDKKVERTTVLATLSTIFLGEYISDIKKVSTAAGIDAWINITPASMPVKLKNLINAKPNNGPITILMSEKVILSLKDKIFNFDRATPSDIKTKKIVE